MNALYILSLDRTAGLVFWAAAVQLGAFYMQRVQHEMQVEWGTEDRTGKWLAMAGRAMGWIAYATALVILYRVGFLAAVVAVLAMFVVPVAVSTLDVWLIRSPAKPTAIAATPLTVLAFGAMLRAATILT